MGNDLEHFVTRQPQLTQVATDYAEELHAKLGTMAQVDGFTNNSDYAYIACVALARLAQLHILNVAVVSPALAKLHREHLITVLENGRKWL